VGNALTHPGKTIDVATRGDRMKYYRMLFSPFAFLPLAAPTTLLLAVPMLAINALSSFPYQREIIYHYAALPLAGMMLATVEAVAFLGRTRARRRLLVGLLLATSLATTVAWGPSPISHKYHSGLWPLEKDARLSSQRAATATVPPGDATSAIYNFNPHLAHREKIYEFPVPWTDTNWGVHGEHLDDPAGVRWIVVDTAELGTEDLDLLDALLAGQFEVRYARDGIVTAERVRATRDGEPGARSVR
jgi:uncharacterized membrane protein